MDYLVDSSLYVCGSLVLPIHHQLLSKEKKLSDIYTVVSHPQALAQCKKWLDEKLPNVKIIAMDSTTAALESIKKNYGYIASKHAAKVYNIPVLAQNIEDTLSNTTRFYIISLRPQKLTGISNNRTLLFLTVYNRVGILRDILNVLAQHNLNLLKLESRPSQEKLWDYHFFVEIEAKEDDPTVTKALTDLEDYCPVIRILGQT
jgi:chorismate mutase/prephenate dehydratase